MAKLTNEDILNAVADMSVMDVVELVSAMEEKFGVSAQECHLDFLLVFQLVPTSMP
jgi:ribosomal protein L7/L12